MALLLRSGLQVVMRYVQPVCTLVRVFCQLWHMNLHDNMKQAICCLGCRGPALCTRTPDCPTPSYETGGRSFE